LGWTFLFNQSTKVDFVLVEAISIAQKEKP